MYSHSGGDASWAYSSEADHSNDSASCASDSASQQELRDLEELLYSRIHYEPNYITETQDGLSASDICVTQFCNGTLDELHDVLNDAARQDISATRSCAEYETLNDAHTTQDGVICKTVAVASNLCSDQPTRKAAGCKFPESADGISAKSKKVDAAGCPVSISLDSAVEKNPSSVNLLDETEISDGAKHTLLESHRAKKKAKHKSRIHDGSVVETDSPQVVNSLSDSSASDAYCCDLSSDDELPSDDADDIKLSNINVDVQPTSDADALADVLNSLAGMHFCAITNSVFTVR